MKYLIGFLAPDGTFTECDSYEHLELAKEIAEKKFQKPYLSGIKAEDLLFENGYIGFYSRNVSKRFIVNGKIILITDKQKDFIIENMCIANNDDQLKEMESMLKQNDDFAEDSVLTHYERKIVS